jgi:hypothetical protein
MLRRTTPILLITCATAAVVVAGCGSSSDSSGDLANRPAPSASDFPAVQGRTIKELYSQAGKPDNDIQAAPSGQAFDVGKNRFGFGLFDVGGSQITDADVAVYAAPSLNAPAQGPYPAHLESLQTEPAFEAKTTSDDPDSAQAVYVTDVDFSKPGDWSLLAMVKKPDGFHDAILGTMAIGGSPDIPDVGDKAPVVHTPTTDDVSDIGQIDTRVPHDTMHNTDLAEALGKQPVVLLFATPALCQSRVCGPVVDVAEQVKSEYSDSDVAFIHMEVYSDNDPNKGYRPQLKAYGLRTEPWLFVIDKNGTISTRIEGAFGVSELEDAVDKVTIG